MSDWQPDPTGRHQERLRIGDAWSASVRDRGVVNEDPVPGLTGDPSPPVTVTPLPPRAADPPPSPVPLSAQPPPPASGYAGPSYAAAPPAPDNGTNGYAIASLVLGVMWLYWLGSLFAVIFGYVARRQIRNSGGRQSGGGLATAGLVLGWLGLATLLALVALFVWAANETPDTYSGY